MLNWALKTIPELTEHWVYPGPEPEIGAWGVSLVALLGIGESCRARLVSAQKPTKTCLYYLCIGVLGDWLDCSVLSLWPYRTSLECFGS